MECTVCHSRKYIANDVEGCWEDCYRCVDADGYPTGVEPARCADDCEGCPYCVDLCAPLHSCPCDGSHCREIAA